MAEILEGGCFCCAGPSPNSAATQVVGSMHFQNQGFRKFAPKNRIFWVFPGISGVFLGFKKIKYLASVVKETWTVNIVYYSLLP